MVNRVLRRNPRLGLSLTVVHLELRRRFRKMSENTVQLLAIGIVVIFAFPLVGGALFGLFAFGSAIVDGSIESPLQWTTMGVAGLWTCIVIFGGYRAYSIALQPDRIDGLLTTIGPRDLIAGLIMTEILLWGAPGLLLGFLGSIAFAVGAGTVLVIPAFLVVMALGLVSGLVVGFAVALVIRNLGVRSVLLTRLRNLLLAILFLAYFAVLVGGAFDDVFAPLVSVLSPTPIGWLGDVLLIAIHEDASSLRATGAIVALLAATIVLGGVVVRLAGALWYADGVTVTHRTRTNSGRGERLERLLSLPVAGVMIVDWARARRNPLAFSFVLYPLVVLIGPLADTFQTGSVGSGFPLLVMFCGAWMTGVLFTLNLLGNEAPVLEGSLLSSGVDRGLVVGHILASIGLAGIPTVVATTVVGILSPYEAPMVALLAFTSLLLVVSAAMIAPGIAVTFPRFEEVAITRGSKAIVPSWSAFGAFSLIFGVVALPVAIGYLVVEWWGIQAVIAGMGVTALVGIGGGIVSSWRANSMLGEYRIE